MEGPATQNERAPVVNRLRPAAKRASRRARSGPPLLAQREGEPGRPLAVQRLGALDQRRGGPWKGSRLRQVW